LLLRETPKNGKNQRRGKKTQKENWGGRGGGDARKMKGTNCRGGGGGGRTFKKVGQYVGKNSA